MREAASTARRRLPHIEAVHRHRVVALAAIVGLLVGAVVAGFERVVRGQMFDRLLELPLAVQAGAPFLGLGLTVLLMLRFAPGPQTAVADEYLRTFHRPGTRLRLRDLPVRLAAGAATLGSGAALGFEGVAIVTGATIGDAVQHRTTKWFSRDESRVLLVAGAAAGVAAIFKAPATGALFAMEVPFRADLARRTLLPTLVSAACGYLTFVAIDGPAPLFPIGTTPPLSARDLVASIAIGVLAGLGARGFSWAIRRVKAASTQIHPAVRVVSAGALIAAIIVGSDALTGEPLALGPGYATIRWTFEPGHAAGVIAGMLLLRGLATLAAVGGGGVGGLFIPLVIEGALLGGLVGELSGHGASTLFPVLGIAAFLGAGYRVPLAAVMFVAEATGRPGFVVPGLLAAATSQLVVGSGSVTTYQRDRRAGHLEQRLGLPLSAALRTDVRTCPPDAAVGDVIDDVLIGTRLLSVPVVDGSRYLGTAKLHDLAQLPRAEWATTPVSELASTEGGTIPVTSTVGDALRALEEADEDRLPVVDADGGFVGLVSMSEILRLDQVLDATDGAQRTQARQNAT